MTCVSSLWLAAPDLQAQAGPPRRVGRAEIVGHAMRHSPALGVARSREASGEAAEVRAEALLPEDPELTMVAGPRRSADTTSLDWEVSVAQRLEVAGERGLRRAAARSSRKRLAAEVDRARWRVSRQVHRAFDLALLAERRLEAFRELEAFAERLLALTRGRQAAGAVAELQVSLAAGEVALARQGRVRAEGEYQACSLDLERLAGWPAGPALVPVGRLGKPRPIDLGGLGLRESIDRHPEVVALLAELAEARARQALARREVFPKPSVGLTVGREGEGTSEADTIILGTVSLPLPLWQRNRGSRVEALAGLELVRARLARARYGIEARVRAAGQRTNYAARRAGIFGGEALPSFARNLRLQERAFEEGKVDLVQVMVARGRLLAAETEAIDAMEDYIKARADLELALGRDLSHRTVQEQADE